MKKWSEVDRTFRSLRLSATPSIFWRTKYHADAADTSRQLTPILNQALTLMNSQKVVTPAKAGVQMSCNFPKTLDSGFRRNDGKMENATFCESINFGGCATRFHFDLAME